MAAGVSLAGTKLAAQIEVNPWGGLRGLRVNGELMPLASGLRATAPGATATREVERLRNPQFTRQGRRQISSGGLVFGAARAPEAGPGRRNARPDVAGELAYEDTADGDANADVSIVAHVATPLTELDYFLRLPAADYPQARAELIDATTAGLPTDADLPRGAAKGVRVTSSRRTVELRFAAAVDVTIARTRDGALEISFPVAKGDLAPEQAVRFAFALHARGEPDRRPVTLVLDARHPGSAFDGVGGNFRLQSPLDPPQVAYNLENLRVAWARANLPLDRWQPDENLDPLAEAAAGRLDATVRHAMEMEQTLAAKKIPLVLTVWSIPAWARTPVGPRPSGGGGGQTYHLRPDKLEAVARSIGAYFDYIRKNYDVEPRLFSFNETDIGYDILATPAEHTAQLKAIGAYFAAHGIPAKFMLGDTGDPTGIHFIDDALGDPEALRYVGAVSYHSWRGGTVEQFTRWGEAARKLGVPLLIGEGGMDADAYRYQALLLEPWYARLELTEYIDICRLSQPLSILQWQLTENYSLLTGGRNGEPLAPAQRFWQLKQLDLTPPGAAALPITSNVAAIAPCAFLDAAHGTVAIHLVNNAAQRPATITGLPARVKNLRVIVTDATRGMKAGGTIAVRDGAAQCTLDATSFTTLLSEP